ncbi:AfsA-related hotdog domain-containing protein [Streptomyces sp. NRRL B-1347]|uniref:AfsA-related hotdog domain-containing protein n=1 Tax=Streptomyces sp. NRRL B-1347 TaxID=1476877 RepID=UPI00068FE3EB|nr:AfsA-related hotdog domain-containing protein [Streptomyces sp. NRRL B-1347]
MADRFAQFADGEQVLTVSECIALAATRAERAREEWMLHLGQGIERSDLDALLAGGVTENGSGMRLAAPDLPLSRPVRPPVVHKHRAENVLLADLRNFSKTHCAAGLRIHRDNEHLLDHHATRHVPGMLIVEAMRQICTAQFETSHRPGLPSCGYAGIWHRIDISFDNFLFPLHAEVRSEITEFDGEKKSNLRFRTTASACQNGGVVARAEIEYSMVKQERIDVLEHRKATGAARSQLDPDA